MNKYFAILLITLSLAGSNPPVPVVPKIPMHASSAMTKGAQKQMTSAKSSFVIAQPVTNYNTLAFFTGWNTNGRVYVQMATNINGPYSDVNGMLMNGQNITNTFSYTNVNNKQHFYRLRWLSFTNQF